MFFPAIVKESIVLVNSVQYKALAEEREQGYVHHGIECTLALLWIYLFAGKQGVADSQQRQSFDAFEMGQRVELARLHIDGHRPHRLRNLFLLIAVHVVKLVAGEHIPYRKTDTGGLCMFVGPVK